MLIIGIASPENPVPKLIAVEGTPDVTTDVQAVRARLAQYYAENDQITLYRARVQADGDILLKKLKVTAGSLVTEPRVVDALFEDNTA